MPVCKKVRGQRRRLCTGDKEHLITISDRNIQEPGTEDATNPFYFTEGFTAFSNQFWAQIKTVSGEVLFDNLNQERDVTHHIWIDFDSNVDAEKWITLESGDRLDILDVEDLDEFNEVMLLRCTNRGASTNANTGV